MPPAAAIPLRPDDSAPPVEFAGDLLSVRFDRFGPAAYDLFLRCKRLPESAVAFDPAAEAYTLTAPARFAPLLGAAPPPSPWESVALSPFLLEDQALLVRTALEAKRFALWCACGWGKTLAGLEYALRASRWSNGRVLVTTVNEAVPEWADHAARFYGDALPLRVLGSRAEMREWMRHGPPGAAVTNYEKWNPDGPDGQVVPEARFLAGVVLDENRLKTGGGKQKWALGKSCKGVEFKLSLTACPAPNEPMEFASQAMFLEKMRTEDEVIWTFFARDKASGEWTVKPHARRDFYEWMSSWAIYVADPKRYGWRLGRPDVPPPVVETVDVPATPEQLEVVRAASVDPKTGQMSLLPPPLTLELENRFSQAAKGFLYTEPEGDRSAVPVPSHKPAAVAGIVRREVAAGARVLVWTRFAEEAAVLLRELADVPGVERLTGDTPKHKRGPVLDRFRSGGARALVTLPAVLGWGTNLQFVTAMVFSGWDYSFEKEYQAVRRAYRQGQAERVRVYYPVVRELEGESLAELRRKGAAFEAAVAEMEDCFVAARAAKAAG